MNNLHLPERVSLDDTQDLLARIKAVRVEIGETLRMVKQTTGLKTSVPITKPYPISNDRRCVVYASFDYDNEDYLHLRVEEVFIDDHGREHPCEAFIDIKTDAYSVEQARTAILQGNIPLLNCGQVISAGEYPYVSDECLPPII